MIGPIQDHYVAINCSTDAVFTAWASILVACNSLHLQKKM
jgi:hypothetical protein